MSDITPEQVEAAKARDTRLTELAQIIAVEADLRDSAALKALMGAVRADAEEAMEELATVSPLDNFTIAEKLVKIRTLVYIRSTLNTILRRGQAIEQAVRAEDHAGHMETEGFDA